MSKKTAAKPESAYLKLSPKRRDFVDAYFECKFNGTQAAIKAQYSEKTAKTQAEQLLTKLDVKEAIEERRAEIEKLSQLKAVEVIDELRKIGFSDITNILSWSANTITIKSSADLPPEVSACISEISEVPTKNGTALKIKLHNKVAALDLLGKYLKLFTDKVELTGKDGAPVSVKPDFSKLSNDELRALLTLTEKVTVEQ